MATSLKREGSTNNCRESRKNASESSDNPSSHTSTKSMPSFRALTPSMTLISKKSENSSLSRNKKPSTTTSPNSLSLNTGSKFSPTVTWLASMSRKETSLSWSILWRSRQESLKTWKSYGLTSIFPRTNGLPTKRSIKSSSLKMMWLRRASAIRCSGRKAKISQSKSSRRRTRRKEERRRLKRSNRNRSLISLGILKSIAKMKRKRKKLTKMLRTLKLSTRLLRPSMKISCLNLLSTTWAWSRQWTTWETWKRSKRRRKRSSLRKRRNNTDLNTCYLCYIILLSS